MPQNSQKLKVTLEPRPVVIIKTKRATSEP